jgi:hypothetical protein
MGSLFKKPQMIQPQTPLTPVPTSPSVADEKRESVDAERKMIKKYGNQGRASTVLTGQGASNTLG